MGCILDVNEIVVKLQKLLVAKYAVIGDPYSIRLANFSV